MHVREVEVLHRNLAAAARNGLQELGKPSRDLEVRISKDVLQIETRGPLQH